MYLFATILSFLHLQGIQKKLVTWNYLATDNFLEMAAHPMVPIGPMLKLLREVVLPSQVKPNASALLEITIEEFWRDLALTSQPGYTPAVARMLHKHGIRLPFARDDISGRFMHNTSINAFLRVLSLQYSSV
jgi:hypothetical protein